MIEKMPRDPDYIVDISGIEDPSSAHSVDVNAGSEPSPRSWIGIKFDCCGTYARIYRNRDGTAYEGRCPRCLRPVEVGIGPGGTDQRMFRAT
ncbi:MAG TPA: hypothetical protein P5159_17665 [Phycisphaerae bacterium]|nr:hypothetical protein [Phycisphaerae bacterium]